MAAQTGWKQEPDDQSERLYSLTLALVQTEVGLTKDEIFMSIRGYRLDLERAGGFHGDLVALNKKFDRDKEKLRELGVQIVPAANSSEGDSDYRYRISREIYEWPEGSTITSKQLQLLELAASLWDRAALSPEATNAITRLRAIADIGDASISQGIAPRISTIEPSFSPLKKAIEERVQVSFTYRRADGQEAIRTVEPWQLAHINGLWMLLGLDVERGAPRNFLLKRIHSKVSRSKQPITEPTPEQITNAKSELAEVFKANIAKIQVRSGTTAAMHFETHNLPKGEVELNYYDLALLAEELLEFGQSVRVVSPPELKDLIRETLEQVVSNHA
jgi:proteasome accessory factor B